MMSNPTLLFAVEWQDEGPICGLALQKINGTDRICWFTGDPVAREWKLWLLDQTEIDREVDFKKNFEVHVGTHFSFDVDVENRDYHGLYETEWNNQEPPDRSLYTTPNRLYDEFDAWENSLRRF